MSYKQVSPTDLVPGQEYVITHIGRKPFARGYAQTETRKVPMYYSYDGKPGPLQDRTVMVLPPIQIYPPENLPDILKAYNIWKANPDITQPPDRYAWMSQPLFKKSRTVAVDPNILRFRAFYKGVVNGEHQFVQKRDYAARDSVAFDAASAPIWGIKIAPEANRTHVVWSPKGAATRRSSRGSRGSSGSRASTRKTRGLSRLIEIDRELVGASSSRKAALKAEAKKIVDRDL